MNPYQFALLFFGFCTFFISLLIWLKRQDAVGQIYLVFSTIVTVWASFFAIMISPGVNYETALLSARILNTTALFIPVTWFHFTLIFVCGYQAKKMLLWSLYLCTLIIVCFSPTKLFVRDVAPMAGLPQMTVIGPAYHLFTLLFFAVVPMGFAQLYQKAKTETGTERSQLLGLTWATFSGFMGAVPTFLPVYGIMCPQYGLFLLPIYPFLMAYFMIRKNLFDEKDLVQAAHRDKLAAIGTIATSINHEIRNPLYIIHGMAESFLHNFRGEEKNLAVMKAESVAVLEKTAQQAKRAMEIMSQLSMFAKQKTNEEARLLESANLQACLDNVLPLVRHEMTLEKISFESRLPADLPSIKANPRQIEEVLFNLLVNACQALKSQGGEIKIAARYRNGKVTFTLEDNGPGIPQLQLKKIFEPFYTTKEEGTGLGLYIVKQLVEKNGGKIAVESKEGQGTRFVLELPI